MKKSAIFIALLCVSLIKFSHAGIGENFEPAGIRIAGDAIFSYYQLDIKESDYILGGSLYPSFGIMTIRNLEVGFGLGYNFTYHHDNDFYDDPHFFVNGISFGTFLTYSFVKNPDANKGVVNTLGIDLIGLYNIYSDDDNTYGVSIGPEYTMHFFVTERIAPYWTLRPSLMIFNIKDITLSINIPIMVGISFHFPRKMRVTHKLKD